MSEREKKLLSLFGVAGVILLAFWGYKSYISKSLELKNNRATAENTLKEAQLFLASSEAVTDEIEWLAEHEPVPTASEEVPTKLQAFADSEATRAGMSVKKRDILPSASAIDGTSPYYKYAQVRYTVTGEERNLYSWFDRMNSPNDFRVISEITLTPNREDDSLIDCIVTFDQWYVPLPPGA